LPLLTDSTSEQQRVGVFALNSFLLLGIGAFGNLLGGAIPEIVASILHVPPASTVALRYDLLACVALYTAQFSLNGLQCNKITSPGVYSKRPMKYTWWSSNTHQPEIGACA
jgi:hypothetical protein